MLLVLCRGRPLLARAHGVRLDGEEPFKRLCAALAEGDAWESEALALVREEAATCQSEARAAASARYEMEVKAMARRSAKMKQLRSRRGRR